MIYRTFTFPVIKYSANIIIRDDALSTGLRSTWFFMSTIYSELETTPTPQRMAVHAKQIALRMAETANAMIARIADSRPTKDEIREVMRQTLEHAERFLKTVSSYYQAARQSRFAAVVRVANRMVASARRHANKILREVAKYLRQFRAARDVVRVFLGYQSWLEEIHFSEHIESAVGDVRG